MASKFSRIFTRGFAASAGSQAAGHHSDPGSVKLWRNLTIFVAGPAVLLGMINAYLKHEEEHHEPRPEFIPYEHLRIRTKPFPWGDGNHSFFHNPKTNALPTGYEEDE